MSRWSRRKDAPHKVGPDRRVNLSVNITYRCNTVCGHCNRGIGTLDWSDVPDMTVEDARRLVEGLARSGVKVKKLKLMGGEPTVHKQLAELCEVFLPHCTHLWVVSNGLITSDRLPTLPPPAKYKVEPLNRKDHHPFFVSPADIGLEGQMKPLEDCAAMVLCGRGVETEGFTQCSLARTVVRALGRDESTIFSPEPVLTPDREICRHCPLSLGSKRNKQLSLEVSRGNQECPTKSFVALKQDYKILEPADAHLRRLVDKKKISIDPSTGLVVDYQPEFDPSGNQLHQIGV